MGVFSWFRSKPAAVEEAPVSQEPAEAPAEESAVTDGAAPAQAAVDESGATEAVEIPKQQSAENAADSEAGEGARK
ncbi:hypothetical protein GCM10010381_69530 [Streptomyces xantholiticus]|nr:hypothetical protein GCM10010381_69530 [Streptomyces xantholiticus]